MIDLAPLANAIAALVAERLESSLGDDVLNTEQAAELLKLHPTTVSQLARSGQIPARRLGKEWRFRRSALLNSVSINSRTK